MIITKRKEYAANITLTMLGLKIYMALRPFKDVRTNSFCVPFCVLKFTPHVMHESARAK